MAVKTFSGGNKLQKRLMELSVKLQKPATLNVGFLEGATYPDGTSVAQVAAHNEYGTKNSPPRPFFRNMIAAKSSTWGENVGKLLKSNDYDASRALSLMGEEIAGQLRESIQEFSDPALAAGTIKAKGFSKPLIDTGHMLNSVDFEVKE